MEHSRFIKKGSMKHMFGRNEACPCGSGKKYKKCCINKNLDEKSLWKERALVLGTPYPFNEKLVNTFLAVFDHSVKEAWRGACHGVSSILYILLKEQGIDCKLQLGFVKAESVSFPFCHSWLTIDGEIFDVGLYRSNPSNLSPNEYLKVSAPIFKGVNLETNHPSPIQFGVTTERIDRIYEQLSRMTIGEYFNGWPLHKDGFWGEIIQIAKKLDLTVNMLELQENYSDLPYKKA
ncbi:SEC-C metal-binding domain-containing protein [Peribacillus sp. B-H-3]|uniref:SEC-C metal-binding domain-containing protein n=1 Tax=Peribacillus sp. B-H-3 TaxID=3400420 RepID=UPI003B01D22D